MTNGLKLLIIAASAIIVCIVCVVGFNLTNEGKNNVNNSTEQFTSMTSGYGDVELAVYDGMTISGAEVATVLENNLSDIETNLLKIKVITMMGSNTYEGNCEEMLIMNTNRNNSSTNINYINPTGKFKGQVVRNANGIIESIEFQQFK